MNAMTGKTLMAAALSIALLMPTHAEGPKPDYEREQRLDDEIRDSILDGEAIDLKYGEHDFLAIRTDAEQPRGVAIILHGRGFHPDWADVASPLRVGLAEQGWNTLSLQMPVLHKEAKYYDYVPLFHDASERIQAAIRYAQQENLGPIVLIAHSCGAHMAMQWVREHGDSEIAAYVGLGMGATDYQQYMDKPFPLDGMKVPVLDLYGEADYPAVRKMAPERLGMLQKAGNPQSRQEVLQTANHYFTGQGEALTEAVANWLNTLQP